ncbi:MAG: hypothetical protein K0R65_1946 [Crocinitomicaceae bacterium]|jgi:hypothetical protein|nr:hypothetical protein [Crocinitomicaceae bacterium]
MILVGYSVTKIAVGVLCVTLAVLILVIAYRKLLAYLGRGKMPSEKYCVLYSIEANPAKGELELYFTSEETKEVTLELLNDDFSPNREIVTKEYKAGSHIVRFDSTQVANGTYFYQLRTGNQKTMKKLVISN